MTLSVDVTARFGTFSLEASFMTRGGLTVLFGPSGSGKTSLMELIGGLRRPDAGRMTLGETMLSDSAAGRFLPPHRRRIGWVFQDARLFPHLTARQNLTYGRMFTPRAERSAQFDRIVDMLDISPLLERRPAHFSGGEKSRVAIGRALMSSPRLLLMDEPLAALDDVRKAEILPYIERVRDVDNVEILYVTHALSEVVRLANEVIIMAAGRIVAFGEAMDALARFDLGTAIEPAEAGAVIEAEVADTPPTFGLLVVQARAGQLFVPAAAHHRRGRVRLRIKARDVLIARSRPVDMSALNVLFGQILAISQEVPGQVNLTLDCSGDRILATITAKSAHDLQLGIGQSVFAIIKSVTFERLGQG